jgi:hypothetical protein
MEKLKFKDAIALGFKKDTNTSDTVFYDKYGFEYFIVSKKINKIYSMDWDIITHNVTLYKNYKTFKKELSIEQIKEYINLLK